MLKTKRKQLLLLGVALIMALTMYPTKAHAQVMDPLEANVPFEFHVGNSTLAAGKYVIQPLDDSDLTVMEIRSTDGSTTAFFDVQSVDAKSVPAKNEVIFKKYGNRYFLANVFEEGNRSGDRVIESRDERRIGRAAEIHEHVTARHRG
jgi:hypothetical protein